MVRLLFVIIPLVVVVAVAAVAVGLIPLYINAADNNAGATSTTSTSTAKTTTKAGTAVAGSTSLTSTVNPTASFTASGSGGRRVGRTTSSLCSGTVSADVTDLETAITASIKSTFDTIDTVTTVFTYTCTALSSGSYKVTQAAIVKLFSKTKCLKGSALTAGLKTVSAALDKAIASSPPKQNGQAVKDCTNGMPTAKVSAEGSSWSDGDDKQFTFDNSKPFANWFTATEEELADDYVSEVVTAQPTLTEQPDLTSQSPVDMSSTTTASSTTSSGAGRLIRGKMFA